MRLVIDSLIAVMLVMLLGGVVWAHRTEQQTLQTHQRVQLALAALHTQAVYHGALGDAELTDTGFPRQIALHWFGEHPPFNTYADARRPWIDVAPPGDQSDHPPDPVLRDDDLDQAGFWYNPQRGLFRARVPAQPTDDRTLVFYNELNQADLHRLSLVIDEARRPLAHLPLPAATAMVGDPAIGVGEPVQAITPAAPIRRTLRDGCAAPAGHTTQ